MKARDYLVSKNLAKPGRGKFSGAARGHLIEAIKGGESFEDYRLDGDSLVKVAAVRAPAPVRKAAPVKSETAPVKPVRTPKVQSADVQEVPPEIWPEGESHAVFDDDGKSCSMKNACNNCSVSLYWCHCNNTHVFGRPVTISLGR